MSTTFTHISDLVEDQNVAIRFWGGKKSGVIVRFTFSKKLFIDLQNVELEGSDGSLITVKELFNEADTVDFLASDVAPLEHISHGTLGARQKAKIDLEPQWPRKIDFI